MKRFLLLLICLLIVLSFASAENEVSVAISPYYSLVNDDRSAFGTDIFADWQFVNTDELLFDVYAESGVITEFKRNTTKWTAFTGVGYTIKHNSFSVSCIVGTDFNLIDGFEIGIGWRILASQRISNTLGVSLNCGFSRMLNEDDNYNRFKAGLGIIYTI